MSDTEVPKPPRRSRRKPKSKPVPIWLSAMLFTYLTLLAGEALCRLFGPEQWWLSSLNLYLPQWLWAIPGIGLLALYFVAARRLVWLPLLPLLWVAGPMMGFCWHFLAHKPQGTGHRLRVMTYNAKWGKRSRSGVEYEVNLEKPNLLLLQDAGGAARGGLSEALRGWNIRYAGQYVVASPLPISELEIKPLTNLKTGYFAVRCTLQLDGTQVTIYTVHFLSPRGGLNAVRHPRSSGIPVLESNVDSRLQQTDMLAEHLRGERGPLILTGDLNAPVQAMVCQKLFAVGLSDAFSAAGGGYGYTYGGFTKIGMPYVRIDHILTSKEVQTLACWAGGNEYSDHCPVIADLFIPDQPPNTDQSPAP